MVMDLTRIGNGSNGVNTGWPRNEAWLKRGDVATSEAWLKAQLQVVIVDIYIADGGVDARRRWTCNSLPSALSHLPSSQEKESLLKP